MAGDKKTPEVSLSLAVLERIDRKCLEFEATWRSGEPGRIEDFLGKARGTERSKLLRELLLLDLDYRRHQAGYPTRQEYEVRFPGDMELLSHLFREQANNATALVETDDLAEGGAVENTADVAFEQTVGASTSTGMRYQILRRHAKGGLGEVFVALDRELGRDVALKEIRPRHADNATRLPSSRARWRCWWRSWGSPSVRGC